MDVLQLPDGSVLVSDDRAGAIYRITYSNALANGQRLNVTDATLPQLVLTSGPGLSGDAGATAG